MEDNTENKPSINEKMKYYYHKNKKNKKKLLKYLRTKKFLEECRTIDKGIFQKNEKKRKQSMQQIPIEIYLINNR